MGELREKMRRELELANYSSRTQKIYLDRVKEFVKYFNKSPEEMGTNEIKEYLHYLITEKKLSTATINQTYSGLKFFYEKVLNSEWEFKSIPRSKLDKKLPVVLSIDEVKSLLNSPSNLKHRTILAVIYSAGLRVSEAAKLKITDIDSKRMMIRLEHTKGAKDRYTILSKVAMDLLRIYWQYYNPNYWLFPGQQPNKPVSARTIQKVFENSAYTIKGGEIVAKDGKILKSMKGKTIWVNVGLSSPMEIKSDLKRRFREYWSVEYENYFIPENYLAVSAPVSTKAEV